MSHVTSTPGAAAARAPSPAPVSAALATKVYVKWGSGNALLRRDGRQPLPGGFARPPDLRFTTSSLPLLDGIFQDQGAAVVSRRSPSPSAPGQAAVYRHGADVHLLEPERQLLRREPLGVAFGHRHAHRPSALAGCPRFVAVQLSEAEPSAASCRVRVAAALRVWRRSETARGPGSQLMQEHMAVAYDDSGRLADDG